MFIPSTTAAGTRTNESGVDFAARGIRAKLLINIRLKGLDSRPEMRAGYVTLFEGVVLPRSTSNAYATFAANGAVFDGGAVAPGPGEW